MTKVHGLVFLRMLLMKNRNEDNLSDFYQRYPLMINDLQLDFLWK